MRWREKFFWVKICDNELGGHLPHTLCMPQPQPFYNFFGGLGDAAPYIYIYVQINLYELLDISFFQTFFKYIHFPETPSHLTNLITFFKCERSFVSTVPQISGSKLLWRWDVPSYLPKKQRHTKLQVKQWLDPWYPLAAWRLQVGFLILCAKKRKTKGFGFLFKKQLTTRQALSNWPWQILAALGY